MTEDERQDLLGVVTEAHEKLSDVAFRLRRELSTKCPAFKAALKAERESFSLERELQRLNIEEGQRRPPLPEVRRGRKGCRCGAAKSRKYEGNVP